MRCSVAQTKFPIFETYSESGSGICLSLWRVVNGVKGMDESAVKLQIKEYWNQRAEFFDEAHENEDKRKWFEYFRNLMGASAGQSVLDIGTGTGFLAIMAAELGFSVTGIDFAEKMLEIARKKTAEKNLDIQYLKADLNSLPFEDESFD